MTNKQKYKHKHCVSVNVKPSDRTAGKSEQVYRQMAFVWFQCAFQFRSFIFEMAMAKLRLFYYTSYRRCVFVYVYGRRVCVCLFLRSITFESLCACINAQYVFYLQRYYTKYHRFRSECFENHK